MVGLREDGVVVVVDEVDVRVGLRDLDARLPLLTIPLLTAHNNVIKRGKEAKGVGRRRGWCRGG